MNKQGDTVWVLEKQVHGRLYTTRLSAGNEKDALAELALFRRDPAAYVARAQEAKAAEEKPHRATRRSSWTFPPWRGSSAT